MANAVLLAGATAQIVHLGVETWRAINESLSSGSGEHNLFVGKREDGDILLHSEQKSSGNGPGYVSHLYEYSGNSPITAVEAKDNWNDDTGGDPVIISGGPGHEHVTVKVTSRFLRGFDHTVHVYGKDNKNDKNRKNSRRVICCNLL